ncbi:MAG: hypothetical protein RLZZ280_1444, partial [Pseudomonadota bacterium]
YPPISGEEHKALVDYLKTTDLA